MPIKISVALIRIAAEFSIEKRSHLFLCCMVNLGLNTFITSSPKASRFFELVSRNS